MKREEERAYDAAKAMEEATAKAEMYRQRMLLVKTPFTKASLHARQIAAQTLSVQGSLPHMIQIQSAQPNFQNLQQRQQKPHVVKTVIREQDYSGI